MTELGLDKPVQDVDAAIAELKKRGAKKVGVTGFCWGGTITWLSATRLKPDAAIAYYGGGIHGTRTEKPTVPTMMHFGDKDMHIPMEHVNELRNSIPACRSSTIRQTTASIATNAAATTPPPPSKPTERTLAFMAKHVG